MAEQLATYIDDKAELFSEILELKDKQKRILLQLKEVRQPHRNILYKKYIKGKKLVDVASELGYDYKHICKEHGKALNSFDNINTTKVVESRH